ncbi:hypothetical protein WMY93_029640 [Mugilogobius chulae]|uniref:EGF-like domain-containing protein n=1 Tax=Mugilogobius chulae TaxID=88201 RepID=A0AAW0MRT6_9GOBI
MDLIPEADKLDMIYSELNAMNARFDFFNEELKWASGHFQSTLDNIENAWLKYSQIKQNNKALESIFVPFYSQFVDSALVLHKLLTGKPQSLADVLAKKLRCHEKDVEEYFLYLNKLVCRGNTMDEKYYNLKGVNSDERKKLSSKIASESALALFESHQKCVTNSHLFIKRDVLERIDDGIVHQEIADNIGKFLQKTYDRYEFMVVAFTSHNSKKHGMVRRHRLKGFTEVERGSVTVAVAKQVKGSYSHVNKVKEAIKKCTLGLTADDMKKAIKDCGDQVLKTKVIETITAIHVYSDNHNTFLTSDNHVYTGRCGGRGFVILIKSDEEIALTDPGYTPKCDNLKCVNGEPEFVPNSLIAMCRCHYSFYGRLCEKSLKNCEDSG